MSETVELTEEAIKAYLDKAILYWRRRRSDAIQALERDELLGPFPKLESTGVMAAKCYVDAYQSMRMSLFGELLQ